MLNLKSQAREVSEQGYCVIESAYDGGEWEQMRTTFKELCDKKGGFSAEQPSISFYPLLEWGPEMASFFAKSVLVDAILCNVYVDGSGSEVGRLILLRRRLNDSVEAKDEVEAELEGQVEVVCHAVQRLSLTSPYGIAPSAGVLNRYVACGTDTIRGGTAQRPTLKIRLPTTQSSPKIGINFRSCETCSTPAKLVGVYRLSGGRTELRIA